jgi:hypothetical protein
MSVTFTGNYREDLAVAKNLGIIKGNPKKDVLYNVIRDYEGNIPESQKISEVTLVDQLLTACNNNDTEKDDRPVSLLFPKPVLKRDQVKKPAPILKRDRIVTVDPLKRPTSKPIKLSDRKLTIAPKPKLNSKFNRSLFQ